MNLLPLSLYIISRGLSLYSKYSSTPKNLIAHFICSYTDFLSVSPTFLKQIVLTGYCIKSTTKIKAILVDFAEPLPPLQTKRVYLLLFQAE